MEYQFQAELSPEALLFVAADGTKMIFDRIPFVMPPKENMRFELIRELKEVIHEPFAGTDPAFIRYAGVEKHQGDLFLVRPALPEDPLPRFRTEDLETACQALLKIARLVGAYQQDGRFFEDLSPGMVRSDASGAVYLLDPPVLHFLGKSLPEEYHGVPAPEQILGRPATDRTASFAWGVLAYGLLTGADPFQAANAEERLDKIVRASVLPLRDRRPEISPALNQLVSQALEADPARRLSLEAIASRLAGLIEGRALRSDAEEARQYQTQSNANRQRFETREKWHRWMKKYGMATGIGLVILVALALLFRPQGMQVLNPKTPPLKVVRYYFQGVSKIDVSLVDETIYRAKNSFADMVTNLHVMNKAQQGYSLTTKDNATVSFEGLTVREISRSPEQAVYEAQYTLKMALPTQIQYLTRKDRMTLRPVKRIWRITDIRVLSKSERREKVTPAPAPASPGPAGLPSPSPAPAGSKP
ncbi:protein kinase-like protein [Hydrogenispora ethanolica]|uniref:Protein kinase-like protein n=1 Tax=Hydrogenispora ethanolica TaxID=1082276 RepID=A0A4R1SA47_HYDET|nr:serine/threonine-protein kinase [Hydrogenispora ethanolica]TCL76375.1 protein kinase-like protein [Hydrogenispora ethanolica]